MEYIRYTDTFCNAVDCRFELTLEVQMWTRARSECLPGGGENYSYATASTPLVQHNNNVKTQHNDNKL